MPRRALLLGLGLCLAVPTAAQQQDDQLAQEAPRGPVHELLARRSGPDALSRAELVRALVGLGRPGVPQLLDVLLRADSAPSPLTADLAAPGRGARELLLEALGAWPRPVVVAAIEERLDDASPVATRLAALNVLARLGGRGLVGAGGDPG